MPPWIMMFPNLRALHLQNNPIQFLPSWIISFKSLTHICANTMFCFSGHSSRPFVETTSTARRRKFTDLIAAKLREYLHRGGDWTVIMEALPPHLTERIISCPPLHTEKQTLRLEAMRQLFVLEKVHGNLQGTQWTDSSRGYVEGAADPRYLPLYKCREK